MSLVILGIIAILIFGFVSVYNSLVRLKNQTDRAWANIDVILKQRFDEIPQLVQVIEQYVSYENKVLSQLIEARKHYTNAKSVKDKIDSAQESSFALNGLLALGENYPELKSNENFRQLQGRISDLENQLSDRREHYNEAVTNFNTRIEQIPDVIIARLMNYAEKEMFEVAEVERERPNLKMNLPTG